MISDPTVFVLGAGASHPVYPLGVDLKDRVVRKLARPSDFNLGQFLIGCGFQENQLLQFREAFLYSAQPTIDDFLEHQPQFRDIGKAAIVTELISCENREALFLQVKWYEHLYRAMKAPSLEEFARNRVVFLTFNYDRSLEFFLITALNNTFQGCSIGDCAATLKKIPVVHFYGEIFPLDSLEMDGRKYAPEIETAFILKGAKQIQVYTEDSERVSQNFNAGWDYICKASLIYFLGFGFAQNNTDRLFKSKNQLVGKSIYSTGVGLNERKKANIVSTLGDQFRFLGDCLDLVQERL